MFSYVYYTYSSVSGVLSMEDVDTMIYRCHMILYTVSVVNEGVLYPHGDVQEDKILADTDNDPSSRQWSEHGVPIYHSTHHSFYVSYVSKGYRLNGTGIYLDLSILRSNEYQCFNI